MWVPPLRYLISLPITAQASQYGFPVLRTLTAWAHFPSVRLACPPVSPLPQSVVLRCRNIHRLSIAYASLPRLRTRLTLSGRAFLRNLKGFFGGQDSLPYRYSYRHSLLYALHHPSQNSFSAHTMLPYQHIPMFRRFGGIL